MGSLINNGKVFSYNYYVLGFFSHQRRIFAISWRIRPRLRSRNILFLILRPQGKSLELKPVRGKKTKLHCGSENTLNCYSSWNPDWKGFVFVFSFLLTRGDHDLVLLRADPQEGEVVLGVDVSHGAPGLHHQLVDEGRVLHRAGVVQSRLDGDPWGG